LNERAARSGVVIIFFFLSCAVAALGLVPRRRRSAQLFPEPVPSCRSRSQALFSEFQFGKSAIQSSCVVLLSSIRFAAMRISMLASAEPFAVADRECCKGVRQLNAKQ